ncbi:MAG: GC-type dockerin domain-anchored protein [Planctomycetota bacterium]
MIITRPCLAAAACLLAGHSAGQLVYDNGAGGPAGVTTGLVADSSQPQAAADGIAFGVIQHISRIEWTGFYVGGDGSPPATDNFVISVRSDVGGPGTIVAAFPVADAVSRTPVPPGTGTLSNLFTYSASISFTFDAGPEYWIQIDNDNGSRDDDRWAWATGPTGTGGAVWFSTNMGLTWFDSSFPGADFRLFDDQPDCPADTNGDGLVSPADFNAWIAAFNQSGPACDQNGDGQCTPADFNAWVINFKAGC